MSQDSTQPTVITPRFLMSSLVHLPPILLGFLILAYYYPDSLATGGALLATVILTVLVNWRSVDM